MVPPYGVWRDRTGWTTTTSNGYTRSEYDGREYYYWCDMNGTVVGGDWRQAEDNQRRTGLGIFADPNKARREWEERYCQRAQPEMKPSSIGDQLMQAVAAMNPYTGSTASNCKCNYTEAQIKLMAYRIKFYRLRHPDPSQNDEGGRVCCLFNRLKEQGKIK